MFLVWKVHDNNPLPWRHYPKLSKYISIKTNKRTTLYCTIAWFHYQLYNSNNEITCHLMLLWLTESITIVKLCQKPNSIALCPQCDSPWTSKWFVGSTCSVSQPQMLNASALVWFLMQAVKKLYAVGQNCEGLTFLPPLRSAELDSMW